MALLSALAPLYAICPRDHVIEPLAGGQILANLDSKWTPRDSSAMWKRASTRVSLCSGGLCLVAPKQFQQIRLAGVFFFNRKPDPAHRRQTEFGTE